MWRKKFLVAASSVATVTMLTACNGGTAASSDAKFPTKNLRIVVPYPAGGGVDIAARAVAPCLEDKLGKTVIVENKAGGSGAVGTNELLSKPADGHTLEMVLTSSAVVTPLSGDVGYKLEDLQPVGEVAAFPYVIIVNPDSPYKTVEDLLAKAKTDSVKAAAPGAASQGTSELKRIQDAGAKLTIVPFDGTAGVKTALVGKNVDFGTAVIDDDILKQHKDGTLRVLAVTSKERAAYLQDVPAVNEVSGFEDLGEGTSYIGLVVKKGTQSSIASTLESALKTCLADQKTRDVIGPDFVAKEFVNGEQLKAAYEAQSKAYAPVITK